MPTLPDPAVAAILDDDAFWETASYEPTQADWDDLHAFYETMADSEEHGPIVGHCWDDPGYDSYIDALAELDALAMEGGRS
jgi:hypothetical protein